jgi:membrane protein implicated in regulation of membrane protease activity
MMDFLTATPPVLWLILVVIFGVLEAASVALTSIWFAAGALVALFVSFLVPVLWIQALVFAVVSLAALLLMRPLAQKMMQPKGKVPTNADRILGQEGVVTETIDNLAATGQVKVSGQVWTARSAGEERIFAGEQVKVLRIDGVKLLVERANVPAAAEKS